MKALILDSNAPIIDCNTPILDSNAPILDSKHLIPNFSVFIARDIATLAAEACHLRSELGTRWTRPMADEQRRRAVVRAQLTELHVTLAHGRGRIHRSSPPQNAAAGWNPRADAAAITERVLARYAAAEPRAAVSAESAPEAAR